MSIQDELRVFKQLDDLRAENERLRADCEECLMALAYIVRQSDEVHTVRIAGSAIDAVQARAPVPPQDSGNR